MSISNGFPGSVKLATKTMSGLMSSSDKIKLDSINTTEIEKAKEDIDILKNKIIPNKIYTAKIDLNNKDPYNAVTYANDAVKFEPLRMNKTTGECDYGSWKDVIETIIRPKPCLFKNSKVLAYLDPNNYAMTTYGSGIDIYDESTGDIMIEFPKLAYKVEKNGNIITISISNKKIDDTWSTEAFMSEDGLSNEMEYMYYSAYEGWIDGDNRLRSLSDKFPTTNYPIHKYRECSKNNGDTYSMVSIAKRMYVTLLTILVTKSLDIKTSIGLGVSDLDYTDESRVIKTGTMNKKGLFYGNNTGINGIKVFGIENFIGNLSEFIEGLVLLENKLYYKTTYPYNDTGNEYYLYDNELPEESGWIKSVSIVNSILIPIKVEASSNTYFSSYFYIPEDKSLNYVCAIGGSYYMNQLCGYMCMDFRYDTTTTSLATGSRIISC